MSQIGKLRTASLLGVVLLEVTATAWFAAGALHAAEDTPAPRGTPGILVEPRPRNNEDADRREKAAPNNGQQERERPGCPVNDRPLELLV
ncbi:MAG: hypothetical protein ABL901_05485 [Hyphomicrobiaceae bacterium]